MNMEEYMGVQTLLMKERGSQTDARAIVSAVSRVKDSGFKAIEVTPAQFKSVAGKEAAIFLENSFPEEERRTLKSFSHSHRPWHQDYHRCSVEGGQEERGSLAAIP
jgi:hypothetical protein